MRRCLDNGRYFMRVENASRRDDRRITVEFKTIDPPPPGISPFAYADLDEAEVQMLAEAGGRWPLDPVIGIVGARVMVEIEVSVYDTLDTLDLHGMGPHYVARPVFFRKLGA